MTGLQKRFLQTVNLLRASVAIRLATGLCCLSLSGFAVNVHGDVAKRDWHRYEPATSSAGVALHTDVNARVAAELLDELARFDVLVDQYIEPFVELARDIAPELDGREVDSAAEDGLTLLVLSRRRDFARLFNPSHFSAFTLPTLQRTTLVVGPMNGGQGLRENLLHEYVHYRLRRDVPGGLPLWFEEGLACYLSQVKFRRNPSSPPSSPGELRVELGHWVAPQSSRALKNHEYSVRRDAIPFNDKAMRLNKLVGRRNLRGLSRAAVEQFYHTSHALVRYLYSRADLDRSALAAALVLDTPNFPAGVKVDLKSATRAIRRHYDSVAAATERFALTAPAEVTVAPEKMSQTQVRRRLADAALSTNPAAASELYEQLTRALPAQVWTWVGASKALRLQDKTEEARLRLAVAQKLAPEEPTVLLEQAATRTAGCILRPTEACPQAWLDAMLDLRDALDYDANSFEAIYRLGIAHLYLGQPGEAQGYLQVAWQRVPWSPRVNFFIGESLRLAGDTRARWYLDGAQRWATSEYYEKAAAEALRRLPAQLVPAGPS